MRQYCYQDGLFNIQANHPMMDMYVCEQVATMGEAALHLKRVSCSGSVCARNRQVSPFHALHMSGSVYCIHSYIHCKTTFELFQWVKSQDMLGQEQVLHSKVHALCKVHAINAFVTCMQSFQHSCMHSMCV